jgi:hypothetical protein
LEVNPKAPAAETPTPVANEAPATGKATASSEPPVTAPVDEVAAKGQVKQPAPTERPANTGELDTIPIERRIAPAGEVRSETAVTRFLLDNRQYTPEGRSISVHAGERMATPPKGRAPVSAEKVDQVLNEGDKIKKVDFAKRTVTVQDTKLPGKPQVVVDMDTGKRVVTVINPKN